MTKRYYYTDPIKAAYMAKEFDVKFEDVDGDKIICSNNIASALWQWVYEDSSKYYSGDAKKLDDGRIVELHKFYVAKESEDILQLKKDDYFISSEPYDGDDSVLQSDSPEYDSICCKQIIIRHNKQFFMPEVEYDK
jgi:hypothetical protein